jgi:hypothetical protein
MNRHVGPDTLTVLPLNFSINENWRVIVDVSRTDARDYVVVGMFFRDKLAKNQRKSN